MLQLIFPETKIKKTFAHGNSLNQPIEPPHDKTNKMCEPSEDSAQSDQSLHCALNW